MCSPGCPRTLSVYRSRFGLDLRDLPAPTSQVIGLKACVVTLACVKVQDIAFYNGANDSVRINIIEYIQIMQVML